jgi:prolyl-tRNA synthetase
VLVDDRNQKPKNMFKVIEFLGIRHRLVISSRSISAGVYEYKDLLTDEFVKVSETEALAFLQQKVN